MSNTNFHDVLYRVIVNLSADGPQCRVTKIRARATAGGYVTEHSKRIRRDSLGKPDSRTLASAPTAYSYTNDEGQVDELVKMLCERIRTVVKGQLEHFTKLNTRAEREPTVTHDEYAI